MQSLLLFLPFALAMAAAGPLGCTVDHDSPEYSLGFYNHTAAQINGTRADWQVDGRSHYDEGGVLPPSIDKVSHQDPRPIPSRATVTWKTADGKSHSQQVAVGTLIPDPAKFSGTIYFVFDPDGSVRAVPLTYAEQWRFAEQRKMAVREIAREGQK